MSRNAAIKARFLHYKDALIKQFGREALDDHQINAFGKMAFGKHWGGAKAQDRVKLAPHKFYIVNTDTSNGPGVHWLACVTGKDTAYIYDSYDRDPTRLVRHLIKYVNAGGWALRPTNLDERPEQIGNTSEVCGHIALAWLLTCRDFGLRAAQNI